eukprot:3086738-Amphidinium_carterae.1
MSWSPFSPSWLWVVADALCLGVGIYGAVEQVPIETQKTARDLMSTPKPFLQVTACNHQRVARMVMPMIDNN